MYGIIGRRNSLLGKLYTSTYVMNQLCVTILIMYFLYRNREGSISNIYIVTKKQADNSYALFKLFSACCSNRSKRSARDETRKDRRYALKMIDTRLVDVSKTNTGSVIDTYICSCRHV